MIWSLGDLTQMSLTYRLQIGPERIYLSIDLDLCAALLRVHEFCYSLRADAFLPAVPAVSSLMLMSCISEQADVVSADPNVSPPALPAPDNTLGAILIGTYLGIMYVYHFLFIYAQANY